MFSIKILFLVIVKETKHLLSFTLDFSGGNTHTDCNAKLFDTTNYILSMQLTNILT